MALMMSLIAMSIDAMLPALAQIGDDLGAGHANQAQLVISALLLGMAAGQVIYGPLSDSIGRKPTIYAGPRPVRLRLCAVGRGRQPAADAAGSHPAGLRRRGAAHRRGGAGARRVRRRRHGAHHVAGAHDLHPGADGGAGARPGHPAGRALAGDLRHAAGTGPGRRWSGSRCASRRPCRSSGACASRSAGSCSACARPAPIAWRSATPSPPA